MTTIFLILTHFNQCLSSFRSVSNLEDVVLVEEAKILTNAGFLC
jgi:hypothetical protein